MTDRETECKCEDVKGEMHPCPYDEDVNNNPDSSCDCCPVCEHECAIDI